MQRILPIDPANVWPVVIYATFPTGLTVILAGSITSVQEPGFTREMYILATQSTLSTGKWLHHFANEANQFRVLAELPIS